ncbi:MAG: fibrobacter succinogenes major paralogous domain-containing protein [Paludibacteraceae bacterium]|nr:fibrobacter succinogenes major paralogous domain-containing protein [Paludibacteraceae bacterium]
MKHSLIYFSAVLLLLTGCNYAEIPIDKSETDNINFDQFVDMRDGQVYKYVQIGDQIWMTENMRYLPKVNNTSDDDQYRVYGYTGSNPNEARSYGLSPETSNDNVPAGFAVYPNFGVLYNYRAAQAAVPQGWRIPTQADYQKLQSYLEEELGKRMRSNISNLAVVALLSDKTASIGIDWASSDLKNENLKNNHPEWGFSGFNLLPAGNYVGEFQYAGKRAYLWTQTVPESYNEQHEVMSIENNDNGFQFEIFHNSHFMSLRCIKN